MRFMHVADVPLGYRQYGSNERFNDSSQAFLHVVEQAVDQQVGSIRLDGLGYLYLLNPRWHSCARSRPPTSPSSMNRWPTWTTTGATTWPSRS
jgi:hypothetical protein